MIYCQYETGFNVDWEGTLYLGRGLCNGTIYVHIRVMIQPRLDTTSLFSGASTDCPSFSFVKLTNLFDRLSEMDSLAIYPADITLSIPMMWTDLEKHVMCYIRK